MDNLFMPSGFTLYLINIFEPLDPVVANRPRYWVAISTVDGWTRYALTYTGSVRMDRLVMEYQ